MGAQVDTGIIELHGRSPEEAFADLARQRGYEAGHGYSGSLSEKDGIVIVGRSPNATLAQLRLVGEMLGDEELLDDEADYDPTRPATDGLCRTCHGNGRVWEQVPAILPDGRTQMVRADIPCAGCPGDGRRALTPAEQQEARAAAAERTAALGAFGMNLAALRRGALIFDQKWGPAAGLVTATHLWAGGYCSS